MAFEPGSLPGGAGKGLGVAGIATTFFLTIFGILHWIASSDLDRAIEQEKNCTVCLAQGEKTHLVCYPGYMLTEDPGYYTRGWLSAPKLLEGSLKERRYLLLKNRAECVDFASWISFGVCAIFACIAFLMIPFIWYKQRKK